MANIEFETEKEYKAFLQNQHLTYLNEGGEAKCYLSNVDDLVYKNLLDATWTSSLYSPDEVITKEQIKLPSFEFPIDLFTHQDLVWGYTSKYIPKDYFSETSVTSETMFLKINFKRLRKAIEIFRRDVEILSKENILIDDLPFNLLFTGSRLVAIDTLSYLRIRTNTLEANLKSMNYALQNVFEMYLQNLNLDIIEESDLDRYLSEVEVLQKQLKK